MGSLIEELKRREAAARAEADRLRSRIEELAEDLARADEQVSRLVIAREEVARVLEEPAVEPSAGRDGKPARAGTAVQASPIGAGDGGAAVAGRPVRRRCCRRPTRTCWKWRRTRGRPLVRAGEFAAAAGSGPQDKAKWRACGQGEVEGLRSKLRLLAARGWLAAG